MENTTTKSNLQASSKEVFEKTSEDYRSTYSRLESAIDEMLEHTDRIDRNTVNIENTFLRERVRQMANSVLGYFRKAVPLSIQKDSEKGMEKYGIDKMDILTQRLNSRNSLYDPKDDIEASDTVSYKKFTHIEDADATWFETENIISQTKNLLKHAAVLESATPLERLMHMNEDGIKDSYGKLEIILSEREKNLKEMYEKAKGKDSDSLDWEYFTDISTICGMYDLLFYIYLTGVTFVSERKNKGKYTVKEIDDRLAGLMSLARMRKISGNKDLFKITDLDTREDITDKEKEKIMAREDALEELEDIYQNKDNFTGFHVNHITSGNIQYVLNADKKTEEKDEYGHNIIKIDRIGIYATKKEAEDATEKLDGYEGYTILDVPTDEYYTVIRNEDGKEAAPCKPTEEALAYAILYSMAMPESFMKYMAVCDELDKAEHAGKEAEK